MRTERVQYPHGIGERHAAPVSGWQRHASPLSLAAFGVVVVLALMGVLGHERQWVSDTNGTRMSIHMPEVIRNGEFLEIRVEVRSTRQIGQLAIGVDQALWEDLTINTLIPAATDEASEDGEFRFGFGELAADTSFLLKIDAQVNPDILGGNQGRVTVYDGDEALSTLDVDMTVLP
ncbi:MAG TPA: hypothetical protein VFP30_03645 [Candidatus Limnocylindria bacterium]|nr:hypothetical protein [Candidatus Limnocylindria bacterium]